MSFPTIYTFLHRAGSKHGELHFQNKAGYVKFVALAYLNSEGWLVSGNGGWLIPGAFRIQTMPPAPKARPEIVWIIREAMAHAVKLIGQQKFRAETLIADSEPLFSSERDARHQESA